MYKMYNLVTSNLLEISMVPVLNRRDVDFISSNVSEGDLEHEAEHLETISFHYGRYTLNLDNPPNSNTNCRLFQTEKQTQPTNNHSYLWH